MAIQLNERDYQIFKLLDEHNVLLEKHISWFVAPEDKPVLIRDRLRKLFYLDYLICQRHENRLPWWSTPTKPLVYMLAPLARTISGADQKDDDFNNNDWQRNHLEIANIRMIFLIAQKEGYIEKFNWQTCLNVKQERLVYSAKVSFMSQTCSEVMGLICHPQLSEDLLNLLAKELDNQEIKIIISRDLHHQENVQKLLINLNNHKNINNILLTTHSDLYKSGLSKVRWHNILGQQVSFPFAKASSSLSPNFGTIEAA